MKPRGYLINGNFYDENVSDSELDLVTPLYLEAPQTKPLSDEEIIKIRQATKATTAENWADTLAFARAIEERHGIK